MTVKKAVIRRAAHVSTLSGRALARQLFLARCALAAEVAPDAVLHVTVHPSARIHSRVRVDVWQDTDNEIVIGADARIGELAHLSLRGGRLRIGDDTDIRRFSTLHVGGELDVGTGVVLSAGVTVHCSDRLTIGDLTIIGEWSTLTDSAHLRTPHGVPVHDAVSRAPTSVGTNCWLGARVTVGSGLVIGDQCVVGSGAVVTRDVPAGWLAAGVPARNIRALADEPQTFRVCE